MSDLLQMPNKQPDWLREWLSSTTLTSVDYPANALLLGITNGSPESEEPFTYHNLRRALMRVEACIGDLA